MSKQQESELFLDIVIEQFLKQQVFPEVQTVESFSAYQLLGSPKVYLYTDIYTLNKIQIYLIMEYPEVWNYFLEYLEIRPRENFLADELKINSNSLVFVTCPDDVKEGVRKNKFVLNYYKMAHDLCCQGTLITTS